MDWTARSRMVPLIRVSCLCGWSTTVGNPRSEAIEHRRVSGCEWEGIMLESGPIIND
jgi:hypothetical protein